MRAEYNFKGSEPNPYVLSRKSAMRSLVLFLSITFISTYSIMAYVIVHGGIRSFAGLNGLLVLTGIMWLPGISSLAVRLSSRIGFKDAGLKIGKWSDWVSAICIPLVLALLTAIICDILDIRNFGFPEEAVLQGRVQMGSLILSLGIIGAIGEELGWRGFLLPKLLQTKLKHPILASGAIWGLWHLPLIIWGGYYATESRLLMGVLYFTSILALTCVVSWIRIKSGSFWTASAMHATHNFAFQFLFPAILFARPGQQIGNFEFVGSDVGIIPTLLYAATGFLLLVRHRHANLGEGT